MYTLDRNQVLSPLLLFFLPRPTGRSRSGGNELTNLPKAEIRVRGGEGGGGRDAMTSNYWSRIRKCSRLLPPSLLRGPLRLAAVELLL